MRQTERRTPRLAVTRHTMLGGLCLGDGWVLSGIDMYSVLGASGDPEAPGLGLRFDRFGKFPGTVPTLYILTYLQAHHLDPDFYDRFFRPGAYLRTHADHMARWHGESPSG